jgi:hypothetical protein
LFNEWEQSRVINSEINLTEKLQIPRNALKLKRTIIVLKQHRLLLRHGSFERLRKQASSVLAGTAFPFHSLRLLTVPDFRSAISEFVDRDDGHLSPLRRTEEVGVTGR